MREEPDASAEKRAEAVGFAKSQEVQDVQPGHEVLDLVEIARGEALEECAFELQGPQLVGRRRAPVRETHCPVRQSRLDRRFLSGRGDSHRPAGTQINGDQRVGVGSQPQPCSGARELDDERPTFEGGHSSDPQLGIETVGEVVPDCPGHFEIVRRNKKAGSHEATRPIFIDLFSGAEQARPGRRSRRAGLSGPGRR